MKADYSRRRPIGYRRTPRYEDFTEAILIIGGIGLFGLVLLAGYLIGPSVYPFLQSIGVGG